MFNHIVLLTDAFAAGYSVKAAARLAKISESEAQRFHDENSELIDERRQDIKRQYAIVNPISRIEMLNEVANLGINGYTVVGKNGREVTVKNPGITVQAIKAYGEQEEKLTANSPDASVGNSNEQQKIIRSLFDELKAEMGIHRAAETIKHEFPEHQELVDELLKTRVERLVDETSEEL